MNHYFSKMTWNTVVVMSIAGFVTAAHADDPDKMPKAITVLKKFAEASGGADKFKELKSLVMTGTLKQPAQNHEGTISIKVMVPDKLLITVEVPDLFSESNGSDGLIAWSTNTMMGPRLLEGKEQAQLLEEADFEKIYNPESFYKEIKTVGIEEIDGDKCYKLKLTKKSGVEATKYYSMKSGLHVKTKSKVPSQTGDQNIKESISDYKEINGMKFPHKIVREMPGGLSVVVEFSTIKVNPEFDATTFALPDDIQHLVKNKE